MALLESIKKELSAGVDRRIPELLETYRDFHRSPELSGQEKETAGRVAEAFSRLGLTVTERVGGHGVVGLIQNGPENGPGPVLMLRGDMDALPIREETGLFYASSAVTRNRSGEEVPVMHACGHDLHTTALIGTAGVLAAMKNHWSGTLLLVAQPAEEAIGGAKEMISDGLFARFPRPQWALAFHVNPNHPTGTVAIRSGAISTGSDNLDIMIRGMGGHGATPHKTKDPVVLAAQTVIALQTIVSREVDPAETAVVTIGAVHGGTQRNIIAESVCLQLTVRTYSIELRDQIVAAIRRISRGLAQAAGMPEDRMPEVIRVDDFTPPVVNDSGLTQRITETFRDLFGENRVTEGRISTGSEDFSEFGAVDPPIPLLMYHVGCTAPERLASGEKPAQLHTPAFSPDPESTLRTGILAQCGAVLELLKLAKCPM
ncbi:MAG: amidohydrolase [Desulfobacteraceae bacterium]|nr:MAG: amidohydrolase [Desulfobacteraceae bacterium]